MAATFVNPAGTLLPLAPKPRTEPSPRRIKLCKLPAETATALFNPGGMPVWPYVLSPQPVTVPSDFKASVKFPVAVTAIAEVNPGGTFVCSTEPAPPHASTLPSARNATLKAPPPEAATILVQLPGTVGVLPHAITVPSSPIAKLVLSPAPMATTFDKPGGVLIWPKLFPPHAVTVPSHRNAMKCE